MTNCPCQKKALEDAAKVARKAKYSDCLGLDAEMQSANATADEIEAAIQSIPADCPACHVDGDVVEQAIKDVSEIYAQSCGDFDCDAVIGESAARKALDRFATLSTIRPAGSPWRPIETAPKDGVVVDLRQGPIVNLGCVWESTPKGGRWIIIQGDYLPTITPSHWRHSTEAPPQPDGEVVERIKRELAMTELMNSEASDEWLAAFQHALTRIDAALKEDG